MRTGVWWSAFALLLVVASALRTPQGESVSRGDRRHSISSSPPSNDKLEEIKPTFKPRDSRRKQGEEIVQRDTSRSRSRTTTPRVVLNQTEVNTFEPRKSNARTRSRPTSNEGNFDTTTKRDNVIQSRTRRINNRLNQTMSPVNPTSRGISRFDTTPLTEPRKLDSENNISSDNLRRQTTPARTAENASTGRGRIRINTRSDIAALDMDVSGTVNTITIVKPTTSRTDDVRNSRKLRYKTRVSETDTNLTGEGLKSFTDEKNIPSKEYVTSQPENILSTTTSASNIESKRSGRKLRTSTVKSMRVVKRPVSRESTRSSDTVSYKKANKVSDEISEDDNYPESFKALIQAKNATSASSPSESLAVKASQKVYKTFTPTPQLNHTGPDTDDWRLRGKSKIEQTITTEMPKTTMDSILEKTVQVTTETEAQLFDHSSRGTTTINPNLIVVSSPSTFKPTNRRSFKSTRNIKSTTAEPTTKTKLSTVKKPIRNSIYARRNAENNVSTEKQLQLNAESNENTKSTIAFKPKQILPRTSYYSRSRNYAKKTSNAEEKSPNLDVIVADKKMENTADMPIIFTYLSSRSKSPEIVNVEEINMDAIEKSKEPFIIKVNSKESTENITENKLILDEINTVSYENVSTTQKYHATYKDSQSNNSVGTNIINTVVPPIQNIQTRKYSRKNGKPRKTDEPVINSARPKEKTFRKYSETYSKTTEVSSNGIVGEHDKPKHKFSSKYRASYLDKPFYKPTVPTITSSTAWLKFFVTDPEISKSVEEPNWFEEEDFVGAITDKNSRQKFISQQFITETQMKMVEGEEIELGSEMNAISFTKPRSPLTSADLKLSESFMKPSQIMNVEASNHSPSVTVSIFDALADVLTSTHKPRISSTTEVLKTQSINNGVDKTLGGVSSNNNVNIINSFTNQNSITSTDVLDTTTKIVQTTDGITQNVLNRLSARENVQFNDVESNPVIPLDTITPIPTFTTPIITPTTSAPTSTTPISQRRPFAFKVLYSETEPSIDKMTAVPTATTDSTAMVYNTVSDLLLSNNRLVSSELTSMLSNNIENIMQNMDENSKSKLSVGMAKLLNTLIPKALNRRKTLTDDEEFILNTTPYSLEDIKDTENIEISSLISTNISKSSITEINLETTTAAAMPLKENISSTSEVKNFTNTITGISVNTDSTFSQTDDVILSLPTNLNIVQTAVSSEVESIAFISTTTSTFTTSINDFTNKSMAIPYIPNYETSNFESVSNDINENINISSSIPSSPTLELNEFQNIDTIQDPSQLSRLQLWVLSKKARVLKMIEEIIKAHHDEIENAPLTQLSKPLNDISNRLTESTTTTRSTTSTSDMNNELTTSVRPSNPYFLSSSLSTLNTIAPSTVIETTTISVNKDITMPTNFDISTTSTPPLQTENSFTAITVPSADLLSSNKIIDDIIRQDTTTMATISDMDTINTISTDKSNDIMSDINDRTTIKTNLDNLFNIETTTAEVDDVTTSFGKETTTLNNIFRLQDTINSSETTIEDELKSTTTLMSSETEELQTTTIMSHTSVRIEGIETVTDSGVTDKDDFKSTTPLIEKNTNIDKDVAPTPNINIDRNIVTRPSIPKKDYVIFGILPNNTVVRKDPNDDILESITEASPYIIYGVLPNNTVIRKFPNGTRVPRIMQKIDILPISPWNLRNPYSPIHNIPAIVRPKSNPIRVSTNTVSFQDTSNNGSENRLTTDTVNNLQITISSSTPNIKDSSSLGITYTTYNAPTEKSTASHVLSLRTTTMLPSVDEILLNSISSATLEEMAISSMTSSTHEPRILTLDIDPETKQIRTEKPENENGNAVFKFIPIDEVTVSSYESNVLKLASTKSLKTSENDPKTSTYTSITESNTQTQVQKDRDENDELTTTLRSTTGTSSEAVEQGTVQFPSPIVNDDSTSTMGNLFNNGNLETGTDAINEVTESNQISTSINTMIQTTITSTMSNTQTTITSPTETDSTLSTANTNMPTTESSNNNILMSSLPLSSNTENNSDINQKDNDLLQQILIEMRRNSKSLGGFDNAKSTPLNNLQQSDNTKILEALLGGKQQSLKKSESDYNRNGQTTTLRSIEEDIRQFEEDSKLLKALLIAMGRDPAELNLPSLDNIKDRFGVTQASFDIDTPTTARTTSTRPSTTTLPPTTTMLTTSITPPTTTAMPTTARTIPTTTSIPTTSRNVVTTTSLSIDDDIKKLQEDTKLLQALLQLNGNQNGVNLPIVSGITSNVRVSSNLLSTSFGTRQPVNPTTPMNIRPVYTNTLTPVITTPLPRPVMTSTLQPQRLNTENLGISTTLLPFNERFTTIPTASTTSKTFIQNPQFKFTTEIPSSSTFSDEEDLAFLQNLKSVLGTKNGGEDPETALANRVIALAVERSLNEIESGKEKDTVLTSTTVRTTTTTQTTTTTTANPSTPSIEDDIRQFEEDTKLLQALLKATGQDPSKLNLPILPIVNVSSKVAQAANEDLNFLSNLLASPSPLNEPFDPLTQKPVGDTSANRNAPLTTSKPYGAKIAVKDDLKNEQDDAQLLQTLIKLQDAQETTTQKSKLALTGQSSDEVLKSLIKQTQPTGMVSEATKASVSLSTEYGNTNDALLAALLKEQGFGPTTASSLDEQLRLAALLNQVVVTPKAPRRTTTPPPPPPAPRRPILDGLAWLWQQWRETATSPGASRPNRGPASTARPTATQSSATSSRVNWFGSGPFVGNADERPTANRIPLEPPSAAEPPVPGRGQLVSAAINVTRAISQFMGAALQGAAQTVQSVIRAGQRAASDVYTNGSGGSG